jgi:Zn-dependent protease
VRPSPVFLGFLAVAVISAVFCWRSTGPGSTAGDFAVFLFVVSAWVVSLSLHEFAHAFVAFRAGDREVEMRGYLTLNPFRYTHPLLSIVLPLLFIVEGGIGLPGGAVYLHRHAFRTKWQQSLAAASGPLVNVTLAIVTLVSVAKHVHIDSGVITLDQTGQLPAHMRFWAALAFFGLLQVTAAVLNLLPVPGLDGWAIIEPYLDPETARAAEVIKPWGMIGVIVLLQVQSLNHAFFSLVNRIYDGTGASRDAWRVGHQFFKFWVKNPL